MSSGLENIVVDFHIKSLLIRYSRNKVTFG